MTWFRSAPKVPASRPAPTPFEAAAREWDRRTGDAASAIRAWRAAALLSLAGVLGALGVIAWQAAQARVQTYVVEVDRSGRPAAVHLAGGGYTPSQAQIAHVLSQWIQMTRARSTDPVVVYQNWRTAYAFLTEPAAAALTRYAQEHDPMARLGEEARTAEIASVLQRSPSTYQVQWRETVFLRGVQQSQETWSALFTVIVRPPADEAQLLANPLGLLIDAFSWNRELS